MDMGPVLDPTAIDRLVRIGGATLATQMMQLFLQHGPERMEQAETGFAAGDMRAVEHAAHSMKSSAGNLGASRLQQASAVLERAADAETADAANDISALIRTFRAEYDAAESALKMRLTELSQ